MADQLPEDAVGALKGLLYAYGFILVLLGGEEFREKGMDGAKVGVPLLAIGSLLLMSAFLWNWIARRLLKLGIAADTRWWFVMTILFLILTHTAVVGFYWVWIFIALATLGMVLFSWQRLAPTATTPAKEPIPVPTVPHEIIRFDYFPASPLQNGWKKAYTDQRISKDGPVAEADYWSGRRWTVAPPDAPTEGSVMIDIDAGAMDRDISSNAALSRRIEFEANYTDSAMFFVRVLLTTRDSQQEKHKLIKFVLGRNKPYRTANYEDVEYTIEIDPPSLGNGWHKIILSLPDEIERSWGREGWRYKKLLMIRLRGKFGISPIRLY